MGDMNPQVTAFRSVRDTNTPFYKDVEHILSRIKDGASKELVRRIREEEDKDARNELKKKLPAICFSGTFTKRNAQSLVKHSGLICFGSDMLGLRQLHRAQENA
jgi:hypothetical protein